MPNNGNTHIKIGVLVLGKFGIMHGSSCLFVGCHKHNGTSFGLAESLLNEMAKLFIFHFHSGHDSFFHTCCDTTVESKETCTVTHHFDKEKTFVTGGSVADFINRLHDGIESCVIANSGVGATEVIVDGGRDGDARIVEFLRKDACTLNGAITTYHNQSVNAFLHQVFVCFLSPFGILELL